MVQYVFNPWRDQEELLLVRRQFYGDEAQRESLTKARREEQKRAVARVSMWLTRQNCPHMVESTMLFTAALLQDRQAVEVEGASGWAILVAQLTYASAFSRFVTGLLDSHQDKQSKQSMYAIAKKIGLPASFVELRHQSTHEGLPALAQLRSMANKALAWIWDYFWKNLADPCRDAILGYLRGAGGGGDGDEEARTAKTIQELGKWDVERVLSTIADLQRTLPGNQVYVRCLKLSKEMSLAQGRKKAADEGNRTSNAEGTAADEDAGTAEGEATAEDDNVDDYDDGEGWSKYKGPWKPKPIGMV